MSTEYPGEAYCFVFDFCHGRVTRALQLAKVILTPPVPQKFAAQLMYQLKRASKSGGRIQLAVITVAEGPIITARIIAIRHANLVVHDTILELARTIPAGLIHADPNQVGPKVLHLLDEPVPVFLFASA
ncbi:hypothetical protein B0H11DRAFT_1932012 [Mycena galericulata]|nr:hypothetical protein B0H11DRAFT_1932012 [Mycena galericulata]